MKESDIMRLIQMKASALGARLFRNNVGALQNIQGMWVKFGLGVGTSDLIGWRTRVITTDMVGKSVAIFTAIEVKSQAGKLTAEQRDFLAAVRASGGIAIEARSVDDIVGDLSGS